MKHFKLKTVLCLFFSLCLLPGLAVTGQNEESKERDLSLFETYLCNNFACYYDPQLLSLLYKLQTGQVQRKFVMENRDRRTSWGPSSYDNFTGDGAVIFSPTVDEGGSSDGGYLFNAIYPSNRIFPTELRGWLWFNYHSYRQTRNPKKEKAELVASLRQFAARATQKPYIFEVIRKDFNGDIARYVDHLYKKSFLLNKKRMYWFRNYPSTVRLETDPGVLFVISLAYYRQMLEKVCVQ